MNAVCILHGLLNACSTLQNVMFSNQETLFFAKWKRVQQIMQIQTEIMCHFAENVKRHVFFHLYLHGLLNVFPTLQNVMFSNQETLFFAKWKTRSANHANTNEKGMPFYVFCKITYDFCLYLHGLLNVLSVLQKEEFPDWKTVLLLQSGNAFSKPCKSMYFWRAGITYPQIAVPFPLSFHIVSDHVF